MAQESKSNSTQLMDTFNPSMKHAGQYTLERDCHVYYDYKKNSDIYYKHMSGWSENTTCMILHTHTHIYTYLYLTYSCQILVLL